MLTLRERLGSPRFFCWVRVGHIFSFQCCVNSFVCLRPVSSVPNVAIVSLDCPFFITPCFLWIVYSWLHLQFSLDCPFLITPSVFSGLSILDYSFGFLWIVHSWLHLRFSLTFIWYTICFPICNILINIILIREKTFALKSF
jgi:hypothetical protein